MPVALVLHVEGFSKGCEDRDQPRKNLKVDVSAVIKSADYFFFQALAFYVMGLVLYLIDCIFGLHSKPCMSNLIN